MGNSYEEFAARLKSSIPGVLAIVEWLYRKEWKIILPALVLRPREARYQDYQDDGDIFAEKDGKRLRFEVKYNTQRDFTCREDWPYGDFFLADKNSMERAKGGVAAYFWVSRDLTHAAFVRQDKAPHWRLVTRYMKNTEKEQSIYVCSLDHVEFVRIKGE